MKLLVTGANGFLGSYVVAEALRRGHQVRALVRPSADLKKSAWAFHSSVEAARADLRSPDGLAEAIRGVDCVIHLAAAKTGDVYEQYQSTVVATENLLKAMTEAGVRHLVAISSFSVYDMMRASGMSPLDEESPVEKDAMDRDAYAHTKLVQERVTREYCQKNGIELTVMRPGVVWGKDNWLNAWMGIPAGRKLWLRTGANARVPLTYVENCAQAIVLAAEQKEKAAGKTFNIVDDALPTQREYAHLVLGRMPSPPRVVPIARGILVGAAHSIDWVNRKLLKKKAKVPGLLVPSRLHARTRPLVYSNKKLKSELGWAPQYSTVEALERSFKNLGQGPVAEPPV